jgi:hypothetical protein
MSSDPSPFSDISPGAANDPEFEAIYAQLMASERGRSFLTEYARRNRQADTGKLVDTIARIEAATRENTPSHQPAALVRSLIDLAAAIEQVATALAASGSPTSADLYAAERIQDIAMALRRREVDAALCDALEAGAREVGDAIVRNGAAVARVLSAASLLHDLARRVNELIALAVPVTRPVDEPKDEPADDAPRGARDAQGLDDAQRRSATDAVDTSSSVELAAGSLVQSGAVQLLLPDLQAPTEVEKHLRGQSDLLTPPIPGRHFTTSREDAAGTSTAAGERASSIFSTEFAAPSTEEELQKKSLPAERPSFDERPRAPANPRAVPDDPLAAVLALSEEELIALFS